MASASKRRPEGPPNASRWEHRAGEGTENLRKEHSELQARMPEEIPRYFNLQVDDWNMNQYGSMIPEVERARRMEQGEWLGSALPNEDYDHDQHVSNMGPVLQQYRLRELLEQKRKNEQATSGGGEERQMRLAIEEHLEEQMKMQGDTHEAVNTGIERARAGGRGAAAAMIQMARQGNASSILASPLDDTAVVGGVETPERCRRRIQLRLWRSRVARQEIEATLAGKLWQTPDPPASSPDYYQPLPEGLFGFIGMPDTANPREEALAESGSSAEENQSGGTWPEVFREARMEHHPQSAETHYIDPEASTRRINCDERWNGDPYQTVHPYLGKLNESGPKYSNWSPHPHLCDIDTLTKRFGSWTGSQRLEIEPQVNAGNLSGERLRLGWGAEYGQLRYPPVGLCNEQSIVPTEYPGHVCRVDYKNEKYPCPCPCPADIKLSTTNPAWPTTSRPHMPWYSMQGLRPEYRQEPFTLKPEMPTAGVPTANNVSLSYRNHPQNIRDPNLREIVLSKTMGQFVGPGFGPEPGDIVLSQRPRCHPNKDRGYVAFCTEADALNNRWHPGDQIIRLGQFTDGGWKLRQHFKMFKLIEGCRWMIVGLLERDRSLVPLRKRYIQKVESCVRQFWPRRGDLLLRALGLNYSSQLDWVVVPGTGPSFKPHQGDVILRVYVVRPRVEGNLAGTVEMYVYDGVGMGWVFMGGDDCLLDSFGRDMLQGMPGDERWEKIQRCFCHPDMCSL